jgi:hypothetical protein
VGAGCGCGCGCGGRRATGTAQCGNRAMRQATSDKRQEVTSFPLPLLLFLFSFFLLPAAGGMPRDARCAQALAGSPGAVGTRRRVLLCVCVVRGAWFFVRG